MTRFPLLFTDFQLTKESILEETKNDPELSQYYDYIKGGNLHIIPDEYGFEYVYKKRQINLPSHIITLRVFIGLNRKTDDVTKNVVFNVRLWLYKYLKKILKKSEVWFAILEFEDIPVDPHDRKIVEIDINELLVNYDMIYPDVEVDVFYKIIDSEPPM